MRKVLVLAASAAISLGVWSTASAHGTGPAPEPSKQVPHKPHCELCPSLHSGFFAGLKGGYASAKGKLNQNGQATILGPVISGQRTDLNFDGGEIGLFLGYDYYFPNDWVLGIEGGAQWRQLSGEASSFFTTPIIPLASNMKISLKSDWSYDVALRFGHKVYKSSLWYVKAGAQFTNFKMNAQSIQTNTATGATSTGAPFANKNMYRAGFLTGMGVEVPLTKQCSLGAEYNFTWYQSMTLSKASTINNGDFIDVKMRPYENQIVARLLWKI